MGIQERVIRARNSNHLECDEFDGDIDVVMAAGMSGEPVGSIFARLRKDFDTTHAEVKRIEPGAGAINHRLAATLRLPDLSAGKAEVMRIAMSLAERHRIMLDPDQAAAVTWQALSVWLDPTCGHCDGRGFSGGFLATKQRCRHCRGTAKRIMAVGDSVEEALLITRVVSAMDECMQRFHQATDQLLR